MMRPLFVDIESAPIIDAEIYLPDFRPRKGTKDEAKQEAQVAEKREAALRDAALDPDLARIVCLGVGDGDTDTVTICEDERAEAETLRAFWELVTSIARKNEDWSFVGFNILSFDLPRLYRRSLYLNVPTFSIQRERYRHARVVDLMDELSEQGRFPFRSLDFYIKRFGLNAPEDPCSGADIPRLVAEGNWHVVREHNACDLVKTRLLAERLGLIKFAVQPVPLSLMSSEISAPF